MAEATKTSANPKSKPTAETNPIYFFDPFQQMAPFVQDGIDRMQALYEELAAMEQNAYERSKQMSTQLADLVTGSFEYATALAREWRQIGLDATQRTAQMFRDKA